MITLKNKAPLPGRYIDPLTDFGFKRIFGSEQHKDLLIAFLNELFNGRKEIRGLVYNPQEYNGPAKHYRRTIFDITCTGADGETFIIEIQRAPQKHFADRAVFYASSQIYHQGLKGAKNWEYQLKELYFIALIDFTFENSEPGKYLHRVQLAEEETGQAFYNKLGFIFIELPNFNLAENQITTSLEQWLYLLRNMRNLEKIPVNLCETIFQKLFQIAETANLKKEDYMSYAKELLIKWDTNAVLSTAKEQGLEQGLKEGLEQGLEQGL